MSTEPSSSGFTLDGFRDVEDYIWDTEGDGLLSTNSYADMFDLVQKANRAFREKRFEEAIDSYSRANCIKPLDHIILSNRGATYIRLSQYRRQRSPSASEHRPLTGLDMTTLAELALKDAEKLANLLNNSVKPYILKAGALILGCRRAKSKPTLAQALLMLDQTFIQKLELVCSFISLRLECEPQVFQLSLIKVQQGFFAQSSLCKPDSLTTMFESKKKNVQEAKLQAVEDVLVDFLCCRQ